MQQESHVQIKNWTKYNGLGKGVNHKPYSVESKKHPTLFWITFQDTKLEYLLAQVHHIESVMHCKIRGENQAQILLKDALQF